MKVTKINKKLLSLLMAIALLSALSIQSFASTWYFGTTGSGSNPFSARGYSILEDTNNDGKKENVWLQSHYTHSAPAGNVPGAIWSDTITGTYYVTSGEKQMYAWLDKGQSPNSFDFPLQRGFTSDSTVDVRNFFMVSINDGGFVSVISVAAKGKDAFGFAVQSGITSPDNNTGWVYPLTFNLKPGTKYTFAFTRGFVANNGISLILAKDVTSDGKVGYTGQIQCDRTNNKYYCTPSEMAEWSTHKLDMYQYAYSFTKLGTIATDPNHFVYSVDFRDFYHTCQTYADLTTLNSVLTDATTFANGVTDNDYKLGNYRKKSVDALKAIIAEINSKQMKQELQTTVDSYTDKLTKALAYAKEPAILVKGITLDKNRADITTGDSLTLKAAVTPSNADDQTVIWKSSNENIATVENGVVKALSAGDVTITATSEDGGYTATCAIAVKAPVTIVPAAAPLTPATTTSKAVTTTKASTTKSTTNSTTVPSTVASTTTTVSTTKIETTATPKSASKEASTTAKKSNSALIIIIIAVAVILGGSIIIFIIKSKPKKV